MISEEAIKELRTKHLEFLTRTDIGLEGMRFYQGIIYAVDLVLGKEDDGFSLGEKSGGGEQS